MRTTQLLNEGWSFVRADVGLPAARAGDGDWEAVTLPHTWNAEDGQTGGNDYHRGACWYRRGLVVDDAGAGRRVFVELGAAGMVADVFVDETCVGAHRGGYSVFRVELTDHLDADGREVLTVRVDNGPHDDVYPLLGDHTFFGGLYRGARLVTTGPLHIDLLDHGSPGVFVGQEHLEDTRAVISVRVRVVNDGDLRVEPVVTTEVLDHEGVRAGRATRSVSVAAGGVANVRLPVTIQNPRRWDGPDDPYLYRVVVDVADGADRVELPFGLRTFEVDPERGAVLNGRPYPLRGASRHHDLDGKGPALTPADHERDLALFEELGVTAVRLAHYQHDQYFYDLCDRAGIAVWAEIPFNAQASTTDPATNALSQMTELIRQSAHHPAIVCWGVQNESTLGEAAADPRPVVARLHELAHREDPTRPTAQANLGQVTSDDPIIRIPDLNAMNLYCGWYYGEATDIGGVLDEHHEANPDVPLGLSEYGADAYVGYHAADPVPGDYTEEYQAVLHEAYLQAIDARPYLWATFVWAMFDFASDLRSEGGRAGRNMKGLVSHDRSVRKDAFYWYKAHWSAEPFVHICSKRFENRHDPRMVVKVYSNLPEVRLLAGGEDLGARRADDHLFTWDLDLAGDTTTVRAIAATDSSTVEDTAEFRLVEAPDESYVCPQPARFRSRMSATGAVKSWYEDEGLAADPSIYSTWTPLGELLDNPDTRAVLLDLLGAEMIDHPQLEMARGMSIDRLASFAPDDLPDDLLRTLHGRLSAIPKP